MAEAARSARSGARRAWLPLAPCVLLAMLLPGCSDDESAERTPASPPPSSSLPETSPDTSADPMAGDWWVLSSERPYIGLRVSLSRADDGTLAGTWTRFDWDGSTADDLRHVSIPAACSARALDDGWVLEGPLPEVDLDGSANGLSGPLAVWLATERTDGWDARLIEEDDLETDGARATVTRAWHAPSD